MKRLNLKIYTKLVRPLAQLTIGWVGAIILLVAGVAVIFMAMGMQLR